ncbi:sugar phosphate nucleotidyltransferase [Pseudonocardia alni]|uniref:Mannose-1-phosphate guanylyltransferase n=1 Tax=Pseudonocardia alni TaxID=33907 RepID=A0A852WEA4_PSEA5|nr:sugar phosphate nucleotidyltransferase [Pseudonocardia antarctica]NYG04016.1 mannose-1-phosphate guanylyltransferase [Pseudonocardia antarctica]
MPNLHAVVQAGGRGTRLAPYSTVLPKALMPVGGGCVIDNLLARFSAAGVKTVSITVSAFGPLIRSYCGDGERWGLEIEYIFEEEPLGTIGPLNALRHTVRDPFFVTNSDVFADVDLDSVLSEHREHGAPLTVVVTRQVVNIAYGVLEHHSGMVTDFREKPSQQFSVSTGIYLMEPSIFDHIPPSGPFGFDELMRTMLARGVPVNVYEHHGSWIDIGRVEDLRRAQEHAELAMRAPA